MANLQEKSIISKFSYVLLCVFSVILCETIIKEITQRDTEKTQSYTEDL